MNSRKEKEPKRLLKRATALSVTLLLSTGSLFTSVAATGPRVEQISFENKTGIISEEPKTTNVSQYSNDTNIDYRIEMNSSERFPKSIYISGKLLGIDKIPVISIYKYIWIILKDSNGKEVYNNIVSNSTGSISLYLDKIAEGKYSVNLYTSYERYGSYKSLIYGNDIEILYKDGKLSFVPYPYYDHNMAVVNNKRTDEKALAYYRQPSSNIQSDNQEIIDIPELILQRLEHCIQKEAFVTDIQI